MATTEKKYKVKRRNGKETTLTVKGGKVTASTNEVKWAVGMKLQDVQSHLEATGATVEEIKPKKAKIKK